MNGPSNTRVSVSYLTLRRVVGLLGVLLPVVVAVWCFVLCDSKELRPSISDYYGTASRDLFVGILFTIGWFLFAYKGYEKQDDLFGDIACVCAICVAVFPTTSENGFVRAVHFGAAAALFLVLAYFSWGLFTKSKPGEPLSPRKVIRNRVYRICAVTIVTCIALIALYKVFIEGAEPSPAKPVFWLEAFALWAFGLSWFVKGRTLWKDPTQ